MTAPAKWTAPWTAEQVAILHARQAGDGSFQHEYTCGNDSNHGPLQISGNGWYCTACDYTQDWAHAEKDPWGVAGLRNDALISRILSMKWFAMPDDMIGGWCIMPVPYSPSSGYPYVAHFLGEELARHIAQLHNMDLALQEHDYV